MRKLSPNMLAVVQTTNLRPVLFFTAEFATGPLYLWSGIGNISWNGKTWTGVGNLGNISTVQETTDTAAVNLTATLSGIPSDMLEIALNEVRGGKPAHVWLGMMDANFNLIADPFESFAGRIDTAQIEEGPETSSITITIENALQNLQRAYPVLYTNLAQQAKFDGDVGFEYVPQINNVEVPWGIPGAKFAVKRTTPAAPGATGGPGGGYGGPYRPGYDR
jgi:hypothetical protein